MNETEIREMKAMALSAAERAYAPYSGFHAGAWAASGKYYMGANTENASYGACICAERIAITKALYDGEREFEALCVVTSGEEIGYPCGICRQFYSEFCKGDMPVICANCDGEYVIIPFGELMPHPFTKFESDKK